jgi:Uma2 family endonuclease
MEGMSNAATRRPLTYEQYLALERAAAEKHEFAGGELFAMSGAKRAHNVATANVSRLFGNALRDRPCVVFSPDMRVRTADDVATYPDVTVVCGGLEFSDAEEDELRNPTVIVEVLSDSTEAYDRGDKLAHYQTIASLRDVVFVATKVARLDHYTRQDDGSWARRSYARGESAHVASVDVSLPVDEVYDKVLA